MQLGTDSFNRIVPAGLATSSDGQPWNPLSGTLANYSVSNNKGHYSYDSGVFSRQLLGFGVSQDFTFLARFTPASANDFFGFVARWVSANDNVSLQINAAGQYSATVFSGGTEFDYVGGSAGLTPGKTYWIKAQCLGQNFMMKSWRDGDSEPSSWFATFGDGNAPWLGQYGLIFKVGTAATSIAFDSLSVTNPLRGQLDSIGGYLFPGSSLVGGTTDVPIEITDGRRLDRVKPEYWRVNTDGTLTELTFGFAGNDGYTSTNAIFLNAHTMQQFVTVAAGESATNHPISTMAGSPSLLSTFTSTMVSFCQQNRFTGIEMDFEARGGWSGKTTLYGQLKTIITALGTALHAAGLQLMVDGPALIGPSTWVWSDFNTLPVDYVCPLVYDHQFDVITGASVSPGPDYALAPVAWMTQAIQWLIGQISNRSKIVIAITSEGYSLTANDTTFASVVEPMAYIDASIITGFSGATRDKLSGEMMWLNAGTVYVFCDAVTMNYRLQTCFANGVTNVDIWYLGGANAWPSVGAAFDPATVGTHVHGMGMICGISQGIFANSTVLHAGSAVLAIRPLAN